MSNQNILIGQIKAEAENLLKEKKSLEKSSNNFEQQTMGLNKNLQKKTNECEIMNKSLNAQHAEIYKLLGDLNERWKALKLKERISTRLLRKVCLMKLVSEGMKLFLA